MPESTRTTLFVGGAVALFTLAAGSGCSRREASIQRIKVFSEASDVFPIVAPYLPKNPVILEGGAFNGENSVALAELWPAGTVHCFEPVPKLFASVKARTAGHANIHPYELALSDKSGTATFHESQVAGQPDAPSQSGSLLAPKDHLQAAPMILFKETITVPTTTIDDWAAKNGVDKVDFLYLDIQGAELPAMKGAPRIMKTVKVLMTELEFVEAYAGVARYQETAQWLKAQGFRMIAADFDPKDPRQGGRWFGDAIFVRD
jgi:FkbM family methyltransferase